MDGEHNGQDFVAAPDGTTFDGATACGDTLFCWSGPLAHTWSAADGWNSLTAPAEIQRVEPCALGAIAVTVDAQIGLWLTSTRQWAWWEATAPRVSRLGRLVVMFDHLLAHAVLMPTNHFNLWHFDAARAEHVATMADDGPGRLVHAWHNGDGTFGVLCESGLFRLALTGRGRGRLSQERQGVLSAMALGDIALVQPDSSGQPSAILLTSRLFMEPAHSVDLATLRVSELSVAGEDLPRAIWEAFAAGDKVTAGRVLDAVLRADDAHGTSKAFAAVFTDAGEVAVATEKGIRVVRPAPGAATRQATADVATWLLWIQGEAALPQAFQAMLVSCRTSALVRAIADVAGDRALPLLFEHAVSGSPVRLRTSIREIRELATAQGQSAAQHVVRALGSENTAVVAAACAAAGAPELWAGGEPPRDHLVACLSHPSSAVRQIAVDTVGTLRLHGVSDAVGALLSDSDATTRKQALATLTSTGDVDATWREAVKRLVIDDPDEDVREEAVRALGTLYDGRSTLDVVVDALGDVRWDPRAAVPSVLEEHAEDLDAVQYYRAADATLLLLMAARYAEDPTDFTMGADRVLDTIGRRLLEFHAGDSMEQKDALSALPPETRELLAAAVVLTKAVAWLGPPDDLESPLDVAEPGVIDAAEFLGGLGLGEIFTPERLAGLGLAGTPPKQMAELALRTRRVLPRLGQRLAVIAAFVARDRTTRGAGPAREAKARRRKLHERLRDIAPAHDDIEDCVKVLREAAEREGIEAFSSLYCLVARKDAEAIATLERHVLESSLGRWNSVLPALLAVESKPQAKSLLRRVVESPSAPLAFRQRVVENWDEDELGPLPDSAAIVVYLNTAECESLPLPERLSAARELAKRGDVAILDRLARTARAELSADDYDDYHFHRDLATAGHADSLAHVRGHWVEMGDLEALNALAAVGTLEDLRELERALELKAPEAAVRRAMEAIRARCAS
jgi:hypothetical protein